MYLHCVISKNNPLMGGEYAFYHRINTCNNLAHYMEGINILHVFPTKKEAIATAEAWNKAYVANGMNNGTIGGLKYGAA